LAVKAAAAVLPAREEAVALLEAGVSAVPEAAL